MYITNTQLLQLRQTAHSCQKAVDKSQATLLEKDYADLYRTFQYHVDGTLKDQKDDRGHGPHLSILFGK